MIANKLIGCEGVEMYSCDNKEQIASLAFKFEEFKEANLWLNLTNGLELAGNFNELMLPYGLCRFRSSSFEAGNWGDAIDSMPDEMMIKLALGIPQVIVDLGANKQCPRALYQGIPIAARILSIAWGLPVSERMWTFDRKGNPIITDDGFARDVMNLNEKQIRRLKYYKKFIRDDVSTIKLKLLCSSTDTDGYYDMHIKQAKKFVS